MIKDCKAANLKTIFAQDDNIIIDSYQRNYEWGRQQWDDFLDTLVNAPLEKRNRGEFMGDIITYRDEHGLHICDGQQRLTTAYTLCLFILNHNTDNSIRRKTERIVYNDSDKFRMSFFNKKDDDGIRNCSKNLPIRVNSNIDKLYSYLMVKIPQIVINYEEFLIKLLDNLCFGFIECSDKDSALQVFCNQNKGKTLNNEDLLNAQIHGYIFSMTGLVKDEDERRQIKEMINHYYKDNKDKWFLNIFVATQNNKCNKQKDILNDIAKLNEDIGSEEFIDRLKAFVHECQDIEDNLVRNYKIFDNDLVKNLYRFLYLNRTAVVKEYQYKDELFKFFRNLIINTLLDKLKPASIHINNIIDTCMNIIRNNATPRNYFEYVQSMSWEFSLDVDRSKIEDGFIHYDSYKNKEFTLYILHYLQNSFNSRESLKIDNETIDHVSPKSMCLIDSHLINSIGNLTILSRSSNSTKNNKVGVDSLNEIHQSNLPINRYFDRFTSVEDYNDEEVINRAKYIFNILYNEFFNYDLYRN